MQLLPEQSRSSEICPGIFGSETDAFKRRLLAILFLGITGTGKIALDKLGLAVIAWCNLQNELNNFEFLKEEVTDLRRRSPTIWLPRFLIRVISRACPILRSVVGQWKMIMSGASVKIVSARCLQYGKGAVVSTKRLTHILDSTAHPKRSSITVTMVGYSWAPAFVWCSIHHHGRG